MCHMLYVDKAVNKRLISLNDFFFLKTLFTPPPTKLPSRETEAQRESARGSTATRWAICGSEALTLCFYTYWFLGVDSHGALIGAGPSGETPQ